MAVSADEKVPGAGIEPATSTESPGLNATLVSRDRPLTSVSARGISESPARVTNGNAQTAKGNSPARRAALVARFWSKVNRDGPKSRPELTPCWEWTGARHPKGYGEVTLDNISGAHRVSYYLDRGTDPGDRLVRHACDYPPCVNPDHLLLGHPIDNSRDARERGRTAAGTKNGSAKLDPESVLAMRHEYAKGDSIGALAERYGVTDSLVGYVVRGRIWKKVGGPLCRKRGRKRPHYACKGCGGAGHNTRTCARVAA